MERSKKIPEPENTKAPSRSSFSQMEEAGPMQFLDKRPEAVVQRKLQELSKKSNQANRLSSIQRMANGTTPTTDGKSKETHSPFILRTSPIIESAPVQRAVITIKADSTISGSAQTVANVTGATAGAFSEVKENETIYIFAHGYHSLTKLPTSKERTTNLEPELMGGITAKGLVEIMIHEGWTEEHKGPIDLRACMSGAESLLPSFAELFAIELKKRGRSNVVTGYKELTLTTGEGEEISKKPTVSKMIAVAQQFDPTDFGDQIFATRVIDMFLKQKPDLEGHREKCDDFGKTNESFLLGMPPSGITDLEWNVFSYYHALSTNNTALIEVLKGNFSKKAGEINRVKNEPHSREFKPEDMTIPEEVTDDSSTSDSGGIGEDLLARLANLKN